MKQKNKPFKFRVSRLNYLSLLDGELRAIRELIGDFTVIKVRNCWFGNMYIWVVPKDKNNEAQTI